MSIKMQQIAQALSMKRMKTKKAKMMAEGGMIEAPDFDKGESSDFDQYADRDPSELAELGKFHDVDIANPENQEIKRMFAKRLFAESEKREGYSGGGIVQPDHGMPLGNKPDLDWIDDGSSEADMQPDMVKGPKAEAVMEDAVSPGSLSPEAVKALMEKKKKRFMVR